MVVKNVAAIAAAILTCSTPAVAQDATAGAVVFKRCVICHSVTPGKGSTIGPNLKGVVGRVSGTMPKYSYSPALVKAKLKWDKATLDRYLTKPSAVVPGNKMAYSGLPSPKDRADLIAYLAAQK